MCGRVHVCVHMFADMPACVHVNICVHAFGRRMLSSVNILFPSTWFSLTSLAFLYINVFYPLDVVVDTWLNTVPP